MKGIPVPRYPARLLRRARKIKLLAMDVDGVLTAGDIIVLDGGEEVKFWSVKDRMGFHLLKRSGAPVKLAWVTARGSRQVAARAREIGIDFLYQRTLDKWAKVSECAEKMGIGPNEVAFVGDDLVDLRSLRHAGLSVCPPDSPEVLRRLCHYETKAPGGRGAVREVIELLLAAQGYWKKAVGGFWTLAFLALFSLGLSACGGRPAPDTSEMPDQWIEQFKITETSHGLPVWVLNSRNAQVFNAKKLAVLEDIHLQFMNPSGRQKRLAERDLSRAKKAQTLAAHLTAPIGEVGLESHDLKVWGGVAVKSEDGTLLQTESLQFSAARQKVFTDSPVKIVRKDSVVLGEGLEATPDLSEVKIFHHEASIYPKQVDLK